ncbi:LOW QUALITY PROTEIN: hypothetical protein HID58_001409 [Brassica napus]|uniref:Uncharacterized protein n=1 Tax=Brassica napus TaxID=3708 RepID=A0ABQ8EJA7_BRANA|nr:LOW QUALITY PROTEIN: hypothetical protein HID58_001409 [Brassica napus]
MASSAAQIHVLCGIGFTTSSSKRNLNSKSSFMPRSAFFGARNGPFSTSTSSFLRMRSRNGGASRYAVGPVRVVNEKVVGIDLGTTNSAVAAMEGGKPTIVTNAEGQRTTPSVVAYTKSGDRLVGQIAKRQAVVNPENTFFSVKRFIGRRMNEVAEESKQVSYRVVEDENGNVKLECPAIGKQFAAEEISAQVLRKLVDDASRFLNDKVTKAVITVPAYFNDSQRTATKDAGRIAGLDVLRIINEPTAASLAYGFERKSNETILVFDLGGGTFDVSVLEVGDGVFEVLSTSGDTHLGGDDFDKRVVDWLASNFKKDEGIDLLKDKQALQRLTEAAEKAKIELSSLTQTNMSLPFITATADGPKHIETTLTRAKFEELCSDLLDRCKTPVENSLRDAKLSFSDIDEVILVGGSTRIPAVQEVVRKLTGKEPNVTVNPDEVVALGAAVQAGVLAGDVSDIVLLDVTPLSIGLETLGGVMTKIIPRNTTLPTSKSEVFSTAADGQTSVEINVLQGEREFVKDNKSLGSFRLDGIPPAPRGVPQIEVKFDIDANGILSVSASDKGTGKKQDITITGASTLPKDEVDQMVQEAERFAKDDKEKRDAIDTKNQADSVVYQTEKQLKELGEKIPGEVKGKVEAKLQELKDKIASGTTQEIKDTMAALNQEVMQIGQSMYNQPGAGAGAGPSPGGEDASSADSSSKDGDDRFIGRTMNEVDEESKQVSYRVVEDETGTSSSSVPPLANNMLLRKSQLRTSVYLVEFLMSLVSCFMCAVLRKLVDDASSFLDEKGTKAVITVPAYFNDSQRTATKDAGRIAGLEVLRIINEPTAASLAYGFERKSNETILVFDLGGGTFDVSVLEVSEGVFQVLSTSGDTHLGGDDFDKLCCNAESCRLARFKLQEKEDIDLLKDKQALQRLIEAAEKAKIELSSLTQTNIRYNQLSSPVFFFFLVISQAVLDSSVRSLPFITATADGPKHIETTLTRAKFEELCSDLLNRCKTPVENSLRDAELKFKDIDEVILVGGSTRIPAVQEVVRKLTGKEPNVTVNPDEVVALGAAVQAGVLAEDVSNIVLLDVTPLSLGTNSVGDVRKRSRGCTTSTRKLRGSERAEVLQLQKKDATLCTGSVMSKIIPRNTTRSLRLLVMDRHGEREFARDNKCLGSFLLDGIPPAPRGVPKIDVKFDIDVNGIFSATATDRATSNKQEITITGATTLPKDEIGLFMYNQPGAGAGAAGPSPPGGEGSSSEDSSSSKGDVTFVDVTPLSLRGVTTKILHFGIDANGTISVSAVDKGKGNKQKITAWENYLCSNV